MTRRALTRAGGVLAIVTVLSACSQPHTVRIARRAQATSAAPATPTPAPELVRPALLITQDKPFTAAQVAKVRRLRSVTRTLLIGYGQVWLYDQQIPAAAVDPDGYRAFTPADTAGSGPVWAAVGRGDGLISHDTGTRDRLPLQATVPAGWGMLRIAGFATTVPGIDLVVSVPTGQRIGVPFGNGLIVGCTGEAERLAPRVRRVLGAKALVRTIVKSAKPPAAGPSLPVISPSVPAASPSTRH
jgi:hypothetical protein